MKYDNSPRSSDPPGGQPLHIAVSYVEEFGGLGVGPMIEQLYRIGEDRRKQAGGNGCEPPRTTVQTGLIRGGNAVNILLAEGEFPWEYRALPDEDADQIIEQVRAIARNEILPALREFAPECDIVIDALARVPPLVTDPDGRGVIAIAPGRDCDFVSRGFFPKLGVDCRVRRNRVDLIGRAITYLEGGLTLAALRTKFRMS